MKSKKDTKKYVVVDDTLLGFIKGTIIKVFQLIILALCYFISFILRLIFFTFKSIYNYTIRLCSTFEGKISFICMILLIFGMTLTKIENSQISNLLEKYALTLEEQSRVIIKQRDLLNGQNTLVVNNME